MQDPETGCLPEAVELAQGGEAMINKAKSIGWKGSKLWLRDTLRAARHQSSDPDDLGPMKEFADLKADLYLLRQERKENKEKFRELNKVAKGDMSDDSPMTDPTAGCSHDLRPGVQRGGNPPLGRV